MRIQADLKVIVGALVGGVIGYFAFVWLIAQGFYALVLPGGMLGLGAGLTRHGTMYLAVICGLLALMLGIYCEWRVRPFVADESFSYFLSHLHQLKPVTWIMIAIGAAMGFWIPFRRSLENKGQAIGQKID